MKTAMKGQEDSKTSLTHLAISHLYPGKCEKKVTTAKQLNRATVPTYANGLST